MARDRLLIFVLLFALGFGLVSTYRQAVLADTDDEFREILKELIERGKQVSCKWDWDCKKLDTMIPLKQPKCYDTIYTYYPIPLSGTTSKSYTDYFNQGFRTNSILKGKHYTLYLQTGIRVEYKCGKEGFCKLKRIDPYVEGTYKECVTGEYMGCLVDPVEYKGRIYQNICVCRERKIGKYFCKEDDKHAVYYKTKAWTCEIEERPVIFCPTGSECRPDPKEGAKCVSLSGSDIQKILYGERETGFISYADQGETISIGIGAFDGLDGPFEIAAFDAEGRIIAKKPVTAISAMEYLRTYGPYRFPGDLKELAERVGLLAELETRLSEKDFSSLQPQGDHFQLLR